MAGAEVSMMGGRSKGRLYPLRKDCMNDIKQKPCSVPPRDNIANQLITLAEEVAKNAADLQDRSYNRLSCVCRPDCEVEVGIDEKKAEDWPALFSKLRSSLFSIKESIRNTDRTIDRLEL
jgi:hypothetical protein